MKVIDWLKTDIIPNNLVCNEVEKVLSAKSKKQIFEIACSGKGIEFLIDMSEKGHQLPYEVIKSEFGKYINGKYKPVIVGSNGTSYTSALFCDTSEDDIIVADTTALCLLGCSGSLFVPQNVICQLSIDKNCELEIHCPQNSRAIIECTSSVTGIKVVEGQNRVRINKR